MKSINQIITEQLENEQLANSEVNKKGTDNLQSSEQVNSGSKEYRVYKPKRDKSIPLEYSEQDIKNLPYQCKFCPIRF